MLPALIKATYNDFFSISHFTDSLTTLSKVIQYKATCAPHLARVTLLSYHIKMSQMVPHALLGMLPIFYILD